MNSFLDECLRQKIKGGIAYLAPSAAELRVQLELDKEETELKYKLAYKLHTLQSGENSATQI